MTTSRDETIEMVVDLVARQVPGHPLRVAVDGITASGKSTVARELTAGLHGRRVSAHLSMDGYHQPKAIRYRKGRLSADGYYEDAYDFELFAAKVLEPLGTPGPGEFLPAVFDVLADTPVEAEPQALPEDGVLVVDGTFLQRPEIAELWDVVVYVDTPFDLARDRGATRDAEQLGSYADAAHIYEVRYHAAARRYHAEVGPRDRAHLIIDNTDTAAPQLHLGRALGTPG